MTDPQPTAPTTPSLGGPANVLHRTDADQDLDDPAVVPAAFERLREAALASCRLAARSGVYPPDLAVEVLVDATAAMAELAGQVSPYVGDFWPTAGRQVSLATAALIQARGQLDAARHHVRLVPATTHDES